MKTKIIGLVAITLALLMSVGMASAVRGNYDVTGGVSVYQGFAVQEIEVGSWASSDVTIGNYFVNATCLEPAYYPLDMDDALDMFVHYDKNITGTGSIAVRASTTYDWTNQYLTNTFALEATGNKVVVREKTESGVDLDYVQELVLATEGEVTKPLITGTTVKMQTCHNKIVEMGVIKSGLMNATASGQTSMVFHAVDVPNVEPAYAKYDYAAGAGAGVTFDWTYLLP
jgi:hypothetical protein